MAIVRCVTMQRNEQALLGAWVRHHGYLFGFENLYVFDNGSDDPNVIQDLVEIESCGVNIIRDYATSADFDRKGQIIGDFIKGWDSKGEEYDFAVTIDTDEFLFLRTNSISISRHDINAYFDSLIGTKATLILNKMLLNMPHSSELYAAFTVPKAIFARGTLEALDHGYHRPITKDGYPDLSVNLGYFHLHHKSFKDVIRAAKSKLAPYVDITDIEKIRNHSGAGHHLIKFFNMTENEYRAMYDNDLLFFAPDLYWKLKFLGADVEKVFGSPQAPTFTSICRHIVETEHTLPSGFMFRAPDPQGDTTKQRVGYFDPAFYNATQTDVSAGGIDPFLHFGQYGYAEGRPWSEERTAITISRMPD